MGNKILPRLCDDKKCTGCLSCVNACKVGALGITTNNEGFYRPKLDKDKCVMCGLCEKSCPVLHKPEIRVVADELKVYAAWHKDGNIRANSSSGGAFTALAEVVLEKGGVVFGAAYEEDMSIKHIAVEGVSGLERLRLSKYAQSCVGDTMKQVREYLHLGRQVLYVGTPCQLAGLKQFLHKDYDNLLAVDIICHGVPSMAFLQKYLEWLGTKYGKIEHINFRDKRKGWYDALRVIRTKKSEKVMKGENDNYWVGFNNNNNLQYCCYTCTFQNFPRVSDITIADFWGIGKQKSFVYKEEIEKGISMIVVNNPNKQHYLDSAAKRMFVEERSLDEAKIGNNTALTESHCPIARAAIYQDLQSMDYDVFRKKYLSTTKKQTIVKLFRERLPYRIIKWIRLFSQNKNNGKN